MRRSRLSIAIAALFMAFSGEVEAQDIPVKAPGAAGLLRIAAADDVERSFWESVRDSDDPAELQAYIEIYPQGHFAPLARIRLKKLTGQPAKPAAPAAAVNPAAEAEVEEEETVPPSAVAMPDASWIGIEFTDVSKEVAQRNGLDNPAGAVLVNVSSHGPASQAGLRPGDIILAVAGEVALNRWEAGDLLGKVWPGRMTTVVALRDGVRHDLDLAFGALFADNAKHAEAGNPDAMFRLGLAYENGRGTAKDAAKAAQWYRKAAELDNADAQFGLAVLYGTGSGVKRDYEAAAKWVRRAAEQGHAGAQVNLAHRYQYGRGVPQDDEQARQWFETAADQEDPRAYLGLARIYSDGRGVVKDDALAAEFYREAAVLGNVPAQNNLARLYWEGRGVARDQGEAARLWRTAALKGGKVAYQNLTKLKLELFDAAEIQRLLTALGYDPGSVDGRPGPKTRAALERFQSDTGLPADGVLSMEATASLRIAEQDQRRQALAARFGLTPDEPPVHTEDAAAGSGLEDL